MSLKLNYKNDNFYVLNILTKNYSIIKYLKNNYFYFIFNLSKNILLSYE